MVLADGRSNRSQTVRRVTYEMTHPVKRANARGRQTQDDDKNTNNIFHRHSRHFEDIAA